METTQKQNEQTSVDALHKVQKRATEKQSAHTRKFSDEKDWPYGMCFRQGDVLIERTPLKDASNDGLSKRPSHQIVDGTTVGSRHTLLSKPDLKVWDRDGADALTGPIFDAPTGFYLEHPTHGDVACDLPGRYVTSYPRDYAQEEITNVAD